MRLFAYIIFVFVVGGLGGIIVPKVFLPYLQSVWPVRDISFLQRLVAGTTIIERTERVVVQEDSAFQAAIDSQKNSVVAIRALGRKGELAYASGLALTNDGIFVAPSSVVKADVTQYLVRSPEDWFNAEYLGIDSTRGLAFFRAEDLRMTPVSFGNPRDIVLGQRLFALGMPQEGRLYATEGIVRAAAANSHGLETSVQLSSGGQTGSTLFSIEGKALGMLFFVSKEETKFVSSLDIQLFFQEVLNERAKSRNVEL